VPARLGCCSISRSALAQLPPSHVAVGHTITLVPGVWTRPGASTVISHSLRCVVAEDREAGLLRVRQWFAPALTSDEVLLAALASSTSRLTTFNSLIATAKTLVGRSPQRVLLLTDRSLHVTSRKFSRRRYKKLVASYPLHTVAVTWHNGALHIADQTFFVNPPGFQLGGVIGTEQDLKLLLAASSPP